MRSTNRMITSHVGSLPRPQDLIELNRRRIDAEDIDETAYQARLREATADVVARQKAIGIDLPNDGEYGHAMGGAIDYSSWWSYTFERLGGLGEWANIASLPMAPAENGPSLTTMMGRRDQARFPAIYGGLAESGGIGMKSSRADVEHGMGIPVCTDAVSYVGQSQVARDIADLQAGLEANGFDEGFMCAIGPASLARIGNAFYETHDAFVWALAEAMREEYKAITDAGLIVQIDEPAFAENWDQFNPEPSIDDYRAFTMVGIEALNHALRGIPREQVRFHCCWGSWHGPHTTDLELRRGGQRPPRARVEGLGGRGVARRHCPGARRRQPRDARRRAPRAGCRPHSALRRHRRARERDREHRLRHGRADASGPRLGQARGARPGSPDRDRAAVVKTDG
jgi:5-methyltetrahydropteroyltriglutamate--homocysteine methyltransferase